MEVLEHSRYTLRLAQEPRGRERTRRSLTDPVQFGYRCVFWGWMSYAEQQSWIWDDSERRQICSGVGGSWIESACYLFTGKCEKEWRRPTLQVRVFNNAELSAGYDANVQMSWI